MNIPQKVNKKIQETTGSISALRTILEQYPQLMKVEINPVSALHLLLEIARLYGLDINKLLNWYSKLLSGANTLKTKISSAGGESIENSNVVNESTQGLLDVIETAIKGILIANFQGMFTCAVQPFLPDDLMLYTYDKSTTKGEKYQMISNNLKSGGLKLNVKSLDLFGVLKRCPTNEKESAFYFDTIKSICGNTDGYTPNELWKSMDFNAFLWYIINKGNFVEDRDIEKSKWDNRFSYKNDFIKDETLKENFFSVNTEPYENYREIDGERGTSKKKKQVLICSYESGRAGTVFSDNIHVWIPAERYYHTRKIWGKKSEDKGTVANIKSLPRQSIKGDAYYVISEKKYYICTGEKEDKETKEKVANWRRLPAGFYINKSIFEFNYDYVMSLKLFNSKTIVTNVINSILSIVGGIATNPGITIEEEVLRGKIGNIVRHIIEEDDTEIDNSSYRFNNEEYDKLMENARLRYNSQIVDDNGNIININIDNILNDINSIDDDATLEEQSTKIANVISGVTATLAENGCANMNMGISLGGVKVNDLISVFGVILEQTIVELIMQVLSPKVMMLYVINSYVMDNEAFKNKNWKNFGDEIIDKFYNLIVSMTKQIKDLIIQQLTQWVLNEIRDLVVLFAKKISLEALNYYLDLIQQLILNCVNIFNFNGNNNEAQSVIDNVNYADIVPEAVPTT